MPELPEVETIKNDLIRRGLCKKKVKSADIYWHRTLESLPAIKFKKQIAGSQIKEIFRRGKFLVFKLDCNISRLLRKQKSIKQHALHNKEHEMFLIMHLRMSGKIDLKKASFLPRQHDRARLIFSDDCQLLFNDTRKFGRWYFTNNAEKIIGKLGIEPMDKKFTVSCLKSLIKAKKRTLKPLLLDQTFIAGIGNIYADEALWYAKLHPEVNSSKLKSKDIDALRKGIIKSISLGIKNTGTSMGVGKSNFYSVGGKRGGNQDNLKVFRRSGEPCTRCSDKIIRIIVGQRSTHLCPTCQKWRKL